MIDPKRLVRTFTDLVRIDSPSGSEAAIAAHLCVLLRRIGGIPECDAAGNIHAVFDGIGEPVMLSAHMDTVEPGRGVVPHISGDKITSDGTTILGADNKAAIAAIVEAIASVRESKISHVPIDVVITVEEELFVRGAKRFDVRRVRAKRCFVFDAGTTIADVTIRAPYLWSVDIMVRGRGAHAGAEPEKGRSAIRAASEIISRIRLGRIDIETTSNIGLIEGGSARNAVPSLCVMRGEVRSKNEKKALKLLAGWKQAVARVRTIHPDVKIDVVAVREFDGYRFDKRHPLVRQVERAHRDLGIRTNFIEYGGGSDANIWNARGIDAISFGMGVWHPHTVKEYTKISELERMARVIERLIVEYA